VRVYRVSAEVSWADGDGDRDRSVVFTALRLDPKGTTR
jgi:hypothetical protein